MEENGTDDILNSKCIVCNSNASFKCSRCKQVHYCSKDHQKSHWKQHKPSCRNFDICRDAELGRYLVADRDLEDRRVLIEELPLVVGPRQEPCCLGCLGPLPEGDVKPTCPGCHWPLCSNICPGILTKHLTECLVLRQNTGPANSRDFRYEAVLPLRCLILQKTSPTKWKQILSMQSHSELRQLEKEAYKQEEEYIVKYLRENYLCHIKSLEDTSSALIHNICGIIEINGLDISLGGFEVQALYPTFYLLQHSCIPNTRHTFRDDDFRITAKTSGFIKKGDHLSTMYSNTLLGTMARREELTTSKYFSCKCIRCSDPRELGTDFSTLICLNQPENSSMACGGDIISIDPLDNMSDWKCVRCNSLISYDSVQNLNTNLAVQVDDVMKNASVSKLEELIWKLEKLVHKNHYHCYTVKHTLIQLYGREKGYSNCELTEEHLQRKIDICEELSLITRKLDPGGGRLAIYLGVILLELSSAWKERSKRGAATLDQANFFLNQCIEVLADEPNGSPGSNLLKSAKAALVGR